MKEYNLTQRTAHAVSDANAESPEKTLADDVLLEIDVVRYALEATNENFPREQVKAAYTDFMAFYEKAKEELAKLQQEMYSLYDEIESLEKEIDQAETVYYAYHDKEERLEIDIDRCGAFHPFRKAELKRELAELHKEERPEWPTELYYKSEPKKQEYEQKKELCTNLQKDFDKLEQIAKKLADKLNPVKELARNIMPKRHK